MMIEVRQLEKGDIKSLKSICDRCFGSEFHITEDKLRQNIFEAEDYFKDAGFFIEDSTDGSGIGFIAVKLSKNADIYPDTAWITLFGVIPEKRMSGYGTMLWDKALEVMKKSGVKRIYIGQDFKNFFSGIPAPCEENIGFFKNKGFEVNTEDHYDLEADIQKNILMDDFKSDAFKESFYVTEYLGESSDLIGFLHAEFPGRWESEAKEALEGEKRGEEIVLLRAESDKELVGYCMLDSSNENLGGLGPIGIAKKIRGRHVGDYILWESLMRLRSLGVKRVNIDWTILKNYYGQFGFVPARVYRGAYKEI